jgi:hypothetical protein
VTAPLKYGIELVDADGATLAGPKDILDLALPFIAALPVKISPAHRTRLVLVKVPGDANDLAGEPPLAYETPEFGYIYISIKQDDQPLYQHPHTVGEVVEVGLRLWARSLELPRPAAGYRLTGPAVLATRPAPRVEGVASLEPFVAGESPSFRIRKVPDAPPPAASLESLGGKPVEEDWLKPGRSDLVRVLVTQSVANDLLKQRTFSNELEEGGFLVGRVFAAADRPEGFIVNVTGALTASSSGASLLHFTFTGDSFRDVNRTLDGRRSGDRILGWYHTHLFPATEQMGLSSIDVKLHFTTFRIPWQLAGLVNLERTQRVLRFYVRQGSAMALCHHQSVAPTSAETA